KYSLTVKAQHGCTKIGPLSTQARASSSTVLPPTFLIVLWRFQSRFDLAHPFVTLIGAHSQRLPGLLLFHSGRTAFGRRWRRLILVFVLTLLCRVLRLIGIIVY